VARIEKGKKEGRIEMIDWSRVTFSETAEDLIDERRDYLGVAAVPSLAGHEGGWDIVLRIDGTYFGELADPERLAEMVEYMTARLQAALGPMPWGDELRMG
jgi:hypothetical protein